MRWTQILLGKKYFSFGTTLFGVTGLYHGNLLEMFQLYPEIICWEMTSDITWPFQSFAFFHINLCSSYILLSLCIKTSCFHLGLYWIHSLHTWLLPLIAFLTAVAPSAHLRGASFFSHSDSRLTPGIKLSRHDSALPCVWKLIPPSLAP